MVMPNVPNRSNQQHSPQMSTPSPGPNINLPSFLEPDSQDHVTFNFDPVIFPTDTNFQSQTVGILDEGSSCSSLEDTFQMSFNCQNIMMEQPNLYSPVAVSPIGPNQESTTHELPVTPSCLHYPLHATIGL